MLKCGTHIRMDFALVNVTFSQVSLDNANAFVSGELFNPLACHKFDEV